MHSQSVSITEAARNFSDFVNRVAYRHESFFLIRGKKPVAELRPVVAGRRLGELPALLGSAPQLGPEELQALKTDLGRIRRQRGNKAHGSAH